MYALLSVRQLSLPVEHFGVVISENTLHELE